MPGLSVQAFDRWDQLSTFISGVPGRFRVRLIHVWMLSFDVKLQLFHMDSITSRIACPTKLDMQCPISHGIPCPPSGLLGAASVQKDG